MNKLIREIFSKKLKLLINKIKLKLPIVKLLLVGILLNYQKIILRKVYQLVKQ
jgi:hypothetical protein